MPHTACPKCFNPYVENEFCPNCGPIGKLPLLPQDQPPKRPSMSEEEIQRIATGRLVEDFDLGMAVPSRSWFSFVAVGVVMVLLVGLAAWLRLGRDVTGPRPTLTLARMPDILLYGPSAGRRDFVDWLKHLDILADGAEKRFVRDADVNPGVARDMWERLQKLDAQRSTFEPQLTAEEQMVLKGTRRGVQQLSAFLVSFQGQLPDTGGAYVRVAREHFKRGITLLTGGDIGALPTSVPLEDLEADPRGK